MLNWFKANPVEAILWIVAIPSTVIMILQTIMLLIGLGGHGDADADGDCDTCDAPVDVHADVDVDGNVDAHLDTQDADGHFGEHDPGLRIFTLRGIVAFFAVGGWAGLSALRISGINWVAVLVGFIAGLLALYFVAWFFKFALRLQSNGTMRPRRAVGMTGEAYTTIAANRGGRGKVHIILQETLTELEAVTECDRDISYGEKVKVVAVTDDNTLVVEPTK